MTRTIEQVIPTSGKWWVQIIDRKGNTMDLIQVICWALLNDDGEQHVKPMIAGSDGVVYVLDNDIGAEIQYISEGR